MICVRCGEEFIGLHSKQKFCGKTCRLAHYHEYSDKYARQRYAESIKSVKIEREVYYPKPRKKIETDAEQKAIRDALNDKWNVPPSEVVHYTPEHPEWDAIVKAITPIGSVPKARRPMPPLAPSKYMTGGIAA